MNEFIKKYQFNYINKKLIDLEKTFNECIDSQVKEASKSMIQNKIYNVFETISEEEKALLSIEKIERFSQIKSYLNKITPYVYGMPNVSQSQIRKLFKKEKKLKLPDIDNIEFSSLVYLGWRDIGKDKLYIVYYLNDKLVGMICRITKVASKGYNICALCNSFGKSDEVAFVSVVCKRSANYKSRGFYLCMDSEKCNERITSISKLEELINKTT
ncbi:FusB/FusC family EF-G-binding protein [Oceanirhabdus seepicola]|uniref:FusB/FusC family EF-G-binding protein n=1 Tax=Oceanirhabdus seepicola TaxID=2828781 RepID=A0A9J6P3D6_9CLOT|nr:FusB/FusC family EF-G-binding protein [Oceanirhabdus seepicola]MCM1990032.1 FusB/FusC family EF-G-binding protein [Oceanirhabdus seepicola]